MMSGDTTQRKSFDWSTVISTALGYEKYFRLMLLLFALGIMAGLSVYVFKRGTYMARANFRVHNYTDTGLIAAGKSPNKKVGYRAMRQLYNRLGSRNMVLQTAQEMGVVGGQSSYEELRDRYIPKVQFQVLDENHFQMEVFSFDPEIVREYPTAMVDTYAEWRMVQRRQFREKAVARYITELSEIRERLDGFLEKRLEYQENTALAETRVKLDDLSAVPVEIVRLKHRMEELQRTKEVAKNLEGELSTVAELSLLQSAINNTEETMGPGRVISSSDLTNNSFRTFNPTAPGVAPTVVVEPDMVEGLEPWQVLEKDYRRYQEEKKRALQTYLAGHPVIKELQDKIEETEHALQVELDVARKAFELELARVTERLASFESKVPEYYKMSREFDEKILEYDMLEKSRMAWSAAYDQLSSDVDLASYGAERDSVDVELIEITALRDQDPVSPSKSKLAMMGGIAGIGLALGIPFLLLRLDTSAKRIEDLEAMLGVRGLGVVPFTDPKILEQVNREPTAGSTLPNGLLECFRLIRSGIALQLPEDKGCSVVMVTSARPSEGKTTNAANLAWAFRAMGEKTLLIDCDLRRGRIHRVVDCNNDKGLSQLLTGQITGSEAELLHQVMPDFDVMPRGPVEAGATERLNSVQFAELIAQWRQHYDRIIVDSPPVLGLSESAFIQRHCDGYVLIARAATTPKKDIYEACRILAKLEVPFYGFVLNGVDLTKWSNMYTYDYYAPAYHYEESEDQLIAARSTA